MGYRTTRRQLKAYAENDERRNLNPHAEAVVAMTLWGPEYGAQNGGSMDFWDSLDEGRKRVCVETVDRILQANKRASVAVIADRVAARNGVAG